MNRQPRIGKPVVCPDCGGSATRWLEDKHGPFLVCMSCSFNAERIRGRKRKTGKQKR